MSTHATLADVVAKNDSDAVTGLINEAANANPELSYLPVRTVKGHSYDTRVCTALPSGSQFRAAGNGVDSGAGTFENREVKTYFLNPRWECDKAVADSDERGAESYIAEAAELQTAVAFQEVCKQMYYGTSNDANGFPGLIQSYASGTMTAGADGVAAGSPAQLSSVWGVKFGHKGVQLVVGDGGEIEVSDVRVETIDGANGKSLDGYVQSMNARVGLQVGNLNGVGRLANISASGGGLNDNHLADLVGSFKAGYTPDALFMSRRSRSQLQKNRAAGSATGTAPIPTEFGGIPIVVTESISDTEGFYNYTLNND